MANGDSIGKFPAPYVEQVRENDPVVVRVDQDNGEIGSRPSGLPKDITSSRMGIQHVGSGVSGSRSNNSDNK